MPILDKSGTDMTEMYTGFKRWSVVDGTRGSTQVSVAEVLDGAGIFTASVTRTSDGGDDILIAEGELEAYIGDETRMVTAGDSSCWLLRG